MEDIGTTITIAAIVSIILPFILKSPKIEDKNGNVRIQFGVLIKIILLGSFAFFLAMFGFSFRAFLAGEENAPIWAPLIFMGFILLVGFCMIIVFNKKYVLCEDELVVLSLFGKSKTYKIKDIKSAKLISTDGIKLVTKDDKKYLVLQLMSNYDVLIKTLNDNNIEIVNSKNQKLDIGW